MNGIYGSTQNLTSFLLDHALSLSESSQGSGVLTLRCRRDDRWRDVYFGAFSFDRIPGASETTNVYANITFTCFDDYGNMVSNSSENYVLVEGVYTITGLDWTIVDLKAAKKKFF